MQEDPRPNDRPFAGLDGCDKLSTIRYHRRSKKIVRIERSDGEAPAELPGSVTSFPEESSIERELFGEQLNSGKRFAFLDKLGEGSFGSVLLVHDENCSREVALKIPKNCEGLSKEDLMRFLGEARATASLQHPNIVPIYELDVDKNGTPYICMPRIDGRSLRTLFEEQEETGYELNELIAIMAKVCDALTFAHDQGQLHQDIKPENIMVGGYGEVFVIDWGSSSCSEDEMCATPAYMSPQQASGEEPTALDDVYCLGGVLFECIFGRLATNGKTLDDLIRKKRDGIIDLPTAEEMKSIPHALTAIALKALSADPAKRYASVRAMGEDLRNYQHGLSVAAYKEPLLVTLLRSLRRRWRTAAVAIGAAVLLGTMAAMWLHERQKEVARWGNPIHIQDFSDDSWRKNWEMTQGKSSVVDGELRLDGSYATVVYFKQELRGNVAIEYDAWISKDGIPGDISVIWGQRDAMEHINNGLLLQIGARDNTFCSLTADRRLLAIAPIQIQTARVYQVRCEIEGATARVFLDGRQILSHTRLTPYTSGYFGVFSWYPGKHFDNIQIFAKGTARQVSAVQRGDSLFTRGYHSDAIEEYRHVATSHPNTPAGLEARYKQGLCYYEMNDYAKAWQAWAPLENTAWAPRVKYHHMLWQFNSGKFITVEREFRRAYANGSPELRKRLRLCWADMGIALEENDRKHILRDYVALREDLFPEDLLTGYVYGVFIINGLNEPRTALARCNDHPWAQALAYIDMGMPNEVLKRFPQYRGHAAQALLNIGRYDDLFKTYPNAGDQCRQAIQALGLPLADVLRKYPSQENTVGNILLQKGRNEDVLTLTPNAAGACAQALVRLGRTAEAMEKYPYRKRDIQRALFATGKAEVVLQMFPENEEMICRALVRLSRTREAIERFPNSRNDILRWLMRGKRWEDVLENFPKKRSECAQALQGLKRYDDIIARYRDQYFPYVDALMRTGKVSEVLKNCPEDYVYASQVLIGQKRYRELLETYDKPQYLRVLAYAELGEVKQAVAGANTPVERRRMTYDAPTGFDQWNWQSIESGSKAIGAWTVAATGDLPMPQLFALEDQCIGLASNTTWDRNEKSDHIVLVHRTLVGDGQLTARLEGFTRTRNDACAGLMIRSGLTSDSPYVAIGKKASPSIIAASRKEAGTKTSIFTSINLPHQYLRIKRIGKTVSCLSSEDGKSWSLLAQTEFPEGEAQIGFTASSNVEDDLSFVFFKNPVFEDLSR